jgi:hypothetical protein
MMLEGMSLAILMLPQASLLVRGGEVRAKRDKPEEGSL